MTHPAIRCDRCRWRDRRSGVCWERHATARGRYVHRAHHCARFAVRAVTTITRIALHSDRKETNP